MAMHTQTERRTGWRIVALAVGAVLALLASPVCAQWDEARLRQWLTQRLAEADSFRGFPGLRFECVVYSPPELNLSAAEIAEIEAEVAGKPDHPKRAVLEQHRHELEFANVGSRTTLWLHSDEVWRWNRDTGTVPYFDTGRLGDDQWRLAPTQIAVYSVSQPVLKAGEGSLEGVLAGAQWLPRMVLHAGFGRGTMPTGVQRVVAGGAEWTADTRAGPTFSQRLFGGFEAGEPVIRRVEYLASPVAAWVGGRVELGDWRFDDAARRLIPSSVSEYFGNGRLFRRLTEVRFTPVDPAEVRRLSAVPSVAKGDPLRGALAEVRSVNDWRPGQFGRDLVSDGRVQGRVPLPNPREAETAWRWIGWTLGGGLLLAVIVRRLTLRAGG